MSETMKDYENELERSFRTIEEGDILTGTIVSVDEKGVILDLNYYAPGVIAAEDFSKEPGFNLKEQVHIGDEVSATVMNKDDHGNIRLSKIEANDVLAWDKLKALKDSREPVEVVIKGVVKGGAVAYIEDVRGFIPASRLDLNYVEDTTAWLNRRITVLVHEVSKEDKKLILSARELLRQKEQEKRKDMISNLEPGFVTEGTVESLQPYGAFIRLSNGLSGLVHVSQISEKRIKKPSDVLSVGDTVKVKVIAIKDGKLSLSMKQSEEEVPREVEEEPVILPDSGEEATTSLASLFANIKL